MLRKTIVSLLAVLVLAGCGQKEYTMQDGLYVPQEIKDGQVDVPYMIVEGDHFTVVQNMAVSYQPSGTMQKNGNEVTMETEFMDQECRWVFELTENDRLRYIAKDSSLPENSEEWKDGTVFVFTDISD